MASITTANLHNTSSLQIWPCGGIYKQSHVGIEDVSGVHKANLPRVGSIRIYIFFLMMKNVDI